MKLVENPPNPPLKGGVRGAVSVAVFFAFQTNETG
jgi:hypothetical protein